MEIGNIKENFVFKTRIDLNDDGDFIELRELNMQEMRGMQMSDSDEAARKNIEYLESIFKDCLVDHSFTTNGEKASKQDVYNELKKSGSLFLEVITAWLTSLPFSRRLNNGKSETSQKSSLPE